MWKRKKIDHLYTLRKQNSVLIHEKNPPGQLGIEENILTLVKVTTKKQKQK